MIVGARHIETIKPCDTKIANQPVHIDKGTKLGLVSGIGGGYVVHDDKQLKRRGVFDHDIKHFYAYIPKEYVFDITLIRLPKDPQSKDWQETANVWEYSIAGIPFGEYYTGVGIHNPPSYDRVLASLIRESEALFLPFEIWAEDYGYESDSRKAYAIWEQRCNAARLLRRTGINIKKERNRLAKKGEL